MFSVSNQQLFVGVTDCVLAFRMFRFIVYLFLPAGELLNFGLLFVQFFATDAFLNKKWRYYGLKVIEYYSYTQEERNNPDLGLK